MQWRECAKYRSFHDTASRAAPTEEIALANRSTPSFHRLGRNWIGTPCMIVDEKTDFREIARDGGLVLSYRAGDFIFREGDTASCIYIVLKGSVEMSTRDKVVVTIPEGKPFGMISLIDKKPRANSARAKEDCDLALLDERTFRVMIEETPGFLWYVINEFAARLRATHALL
jgi:CRP/FNR family transcriptional regulator, cyclic AMP receptor protein